MPTAGAWWDDQSPCTRSLSEQAAKRLKDGSFEICRWERARIIGPIRTQPKRTTYDQPSSAARCSVYGGNRNLPFSMRNT